MKHFVYLVLAVFLFAACENVNTDIADPMDSLDSEDSLELQTRAMVLDGEGVLLGYLVSASVPYFNMMTIEDYLVTITWDGVVLQSVSMYFPESGYGGTPFALYTENYSPYGRSAWQVDGVYWTFAHTFEGYADPLEVPYTSYQSMILNEHTRFSSYSGNITGTNQSYELISIDRETLGLPETVVLPISMQWDS